MEEQYFLVRRLGLGREVVCRSVVVKRYLTEVSCDGRDKRLVCRYNERQIWRGC